jgi:hypothetical protein
MNYDIGIIQTILLLVQIVGLWKTVQLYREFTGELTKTVALRKEFNRRIEKLNKTTPSPNPING